MLHSNTGRSRAVLPLRPPAMTCRRYRPNRQSPPAPPARPAAPRIGFVSLGCPKALVDSEQILTQLRAEGYAISPTYDGADIVVVNTCGFIDAAVAESLDAIGEALAENGKVIVTGCLGAKDGGEFVRAAHPKVLAVTGPHATAEVDGRRPRAPAEAARPVRRPRAGAGNEAHAEHYAYLKISEGCNHRCTFCIIPSMRGDLVSRPIGEVLGEARRLLRRGREGAAGGLAGHQRVRCRRALPDGVLGRSTGEDADDRASRTRSMRSDAGTARGCGCTTCIRTHMSTRSSGGWPPRSRRRRAAALSRRALPAREPAHPAADEAARQRGAARCGGHRGLARRPAGSS